MTVTGDQKKNVLVVGAGPIGLTAALELSRRGFGVRIIDKGESFTPVAQSRALGVNNRSLQLLEPSAVTNRLLAQGNKVSQFKAFNEQHRQVIQFDYANAGLPYPFMLVLPQGRTERELAAALKAFEVKVEWKCEAVAFHRDASRPSVDVKQGESIETITADILIGADGASSAVRTAFSFSFDGEAYPAEFGLVDIELEAPIDPATAIIRFTENGVLGCIPIHQNVVRYISPRPDISSVLPQDLKIQNVIWQSSFHISFRHVETLQKGNVFLVGDAAHVHSPAGARGMNLGIEDACWLAYLIEQNKTDDYSAMRLPAIRRVINQTKQQTDALVHLGPVQRFVRDNLASSLIKIPMLKRNALISLAGLDTVEPVWL